MQENSYDAILVLSFGGPESSADVMPFLERVTAGKPVPKERLEEVAEHYYHFGGSSPINGQARKFIAELKTTLADEHEIKLPIYWGNRNWHPLVEETVNQMKNDGIGRALTYATSAFSSFSGCRQYLQDIERARTAAGENAPQIDKLSPFWNHPGFLNAVADSTAAALGRMDEKTAESAHVVFTAHSIPLSMAAACDYQSQLEEAAQLVADMVGTKNRYSVAYQSRSGPPSQQWLEPDILDYLQALKVGGVEAVVVVPLGFLSDHMEVVYDLDFEASKRAAELGLRFERAATVDTSKKYVNAVAELISENISGSASSARLGTAGTRPQPCKEHCCSYLVPQASGSDTERSATLNNLTQRAGLSPSSGAEDIGVKVASVSPERGA